MSLTKNDLMKLAKIAANAKSSAPVAYSFGEEGFSTEDVNETLRSELKALACNYSAYRENKNTIFALIETAIDDVLPKKVMEQFSMFAEVKQFAQGDKAIFLQKITEASKKRAKQFITKVGVAGRYEVFKLDGREVEVQMTAIGGAAQIGFEEFLDGRVDFADLVAIVVEGMNEFIYKEIQKALVAAITNLPAANKSANAGFVEANFDELVQIARAYGDATIYCTYDFATSMLPLNAWVEGRMSDKMKNEYWENGRLLTYKNANVVLLEESYEDETNAKKVFDPSYAYIIPGAKKPVKIAFEGQTAVREADNEDWSKELQTYKKFGVATLITNDICVYRNTSLAQSYKGSALTDNWEVLD